MKQVSCLSIPLFSLLVGTAFIYSEESLTYKSNDARKSIVNVDLSKSNDWTVLPFAFSSSSTGLAGGMGVIKQGIFQPQTTFVASIFGTLPKSVVTAPNQQESSFKGTFFYFSDYKLPFSNRLFFSVTALKSYFPDTQYYLDGSNNSNKNNVLKTSGSSDFFNTTFKYVLPIGEGIDNPQGLYTLKHGFCVGREGCGGNTPLITGRTSIGIKTFYQTDTFDDASFSYTPSWNTNGLRFFFTHDNTDFDLNPSRGYHFDIQYSKDFGEGDSLQSWDFLEAKYNHYINLETFSFTKQDVLALSVWSGYSFSWDTNKKITSAIDAHRPPTWEGARLGGFFKMRGYENNRFSDKAAFYATAEYRAVLNYNPLGGDDFLPISIDWFQVVAFVEAGRVHDTYTLDLLSDMKYDAGISLRALVAELPVRLDIAYGKEGVNAWVMINQPFDF